MDRVTHTICDKCGKWAIPNDPGPQTCRSCGTHYELCRGFACGPPPTGCNPLVIAFPVGNTGGS